MTNEPRPSPLQAALDRVGDRWSLLVVEALLDGPRHFNDLQTALPGIAPNILSDRLKRLERERVLLASASSPEPCACSQTGVPAPEPRTRFATTLAGRRWRLAGIARRAPEALPKTRLLSCD